MYLYQYKFLIIPTFAWFTVQIFKFLSDSIIHRRINFKRFVETGGMPSSHSAVVTSLMTAIGISEGLSSPLFAVSFVFSFIVMYDAAGVRRAAGKQARVLNQIIESEGKNINIQEKLVEFLGHTPVEVFCGAITGIVLGSILMFLWEH